MAQSKISEVYFSIKNPGIFHTNPNCKEGDNIDEEHKKAVTLEDAKRRGMRECKRCKQYQRP